jgi:hypothetical protein
MRRLIVCGRTLTKAAAMLRGAFTQALRELGEGLATPIG